MNEQVLIINNNNSWARAEKTELGTNRPTENCTVNGPVSV
jgi:hypothetical protein